MHFPTRRAAALSLLALACAAPAALAQSWPDKPLRILVGASPGGGTDILARMLADKFAADLKQSVVVENRPGASNTIAAEITAKATADGTTLLLATNTAQAIEAIPMATTGGMLFLRLTGLELTSDRFGLGDRSARLVRRAVVGDAHLALNVEQRAVDAGEVAARFEQSLLGLGQTQQRLVPREGRRAGLEPGRNHGGEQRRVPDQGLVERLFGGADVSGNAHLRNG